MRQLILKQYDRQDNDELKRLEEQLQRCQEWLQENPNDEDVKEKCKQLEKEISIAKGD